MRQNIEKNKVITNVTKEILKLRERMDHATGTELEELTQQYDKLLELKNTKKDQSKRSKMAEINRKNSLLNRKRKEEQKKSLQRPTSASDPFARIVSSDVLNKNKKKQTQAPLKTQKQRIRKVEHNFDLSIDLSSMQTTPRTHKTPTNPSNTHPNL